MGVFQRRPGDDVEGVVACIETLAVVFGTAPIPCTRTGAVPGVPLELWRGQLERDGVADNALAGRRCESKVKVSDGAGCRTTVSMAV